MCSSSFHKIGVPRKVADFLGRGETYEAVTNNTLAYCFNCKICLDDELRSSQRDNCFKSRSCFQERFCFMCSSSFHKIGVPRKVADFLGRGETYEAVTNNTLAYCFNCKICLDDELRSSQRDNYMYSAPLQKQGRLFFWLFELSQNRGPPKSRRLLQSFQRKPFSLMRTNIYL